MLEELHYFVFLVFPPQYPTSVLIIPSSLLNLISGPQKHPQAKTAISIDNFFNCSKVIIMLSKNQLGFLYMFISVCAFSIMDLIVKWSENYPVGEVLFFRGFCGLIPLFFFNSKRKVF